MTLELAASYWAFDQLPGEQLPDVAIQALRKKGDILLYSLVDTIGVESGVVKEAKTLSCLSGLSRAAFLLS